MDALDIEARSALVRMLSIDLWPQNAILHIEETDVQERARVCARSQIRSETYAALGVNVATEGCISRASESEVVRFGKAKTLRTRTAECRRQKA